MKPWPWASRAASTIAVQCACWPKLKPMFSAALSEDRVVSCSVVEIRQRSASKLQSRASTPSTRMRPRWTAQMRLTDLVHELLPELVSPRIDWPPKNRPR